MKIVSYIPIFIFSLYLDFADCSSGAPVSWNTGQRPPSSAPYWKDMETMGIKVRVKKDPNQNGKMIDIELQEGQVRPSLQDTRLILHVSDPDTDLEYIVHKNSAGKVVAVTPVNSKYKQMLEKKLKKDEERQNRNKQ